MPDPLQELESGLAEIERTYCAAFSGARDEQALRAANAQFAGPNGRLTNLLKLMRDVPGDRRRDLGQRANALKDQIQALFDQSLERLGREARRAELEGPPLDVTLPARGTPPGSLHPMTQVTYELVDIFTSLGFEVADGPQIDLHEYNFDKLGFPPDHPATDMQDSFFLAGRDGDVSREALLRTHTSTIQVREMLRRKPPLAVVSPGAVFRRDDDATHSPMFFQIECLLVDEGVTFADLKGTLSLFAERLFGAGVTIRVRPSYFPFVEPGGEVDIGCVFCRPWERNVERTKACRVCKGTGWLEILGCGMVHPVVFEAVGYDPQRYTGFAFGLGIDRVTMLKHGIGDLRTMYENDVRFLEQF